MAAKASVMQPLSLSVRSCCQPFSLKARPRPQWQARGPFARTNTPRTAVTTSRRPFSTSISLHSTNKKYTETHEWISLSSDGKTGTIGISSYAAKSLGDVVYVELPTPSPTNHISSGDNISAVESVKSVSDINSPVSGTIVAANELLAEKPGMINKSPEEEGWIAKIEVVGGEGGKVEGETEGLMDKEKYEEFTADE